MAFENDKSKDFAAFAHPKKVVSAGWLSARLGSPGLKVVECDADSLLYSIGHIPTAIRIDWFADLNDHTTRDFIDGLAFARLMDRLGIDREDTVVFYGDSANAWAAYALWVFELFGHPDVRLLDGGRDLWLSEERDISFDVPSYHTTGYPVVSRDDHAQRILAPEIRRRVTDLQLLDVRDEKDFLGTSPTAPAHSPLHTARSGHIPGAQHLDATQLLYHNGRFKNPYDLAEPLTGVDSTAETVVYCLLGDQSAHTWFILKYIYGFENVRNYDGSWSEWGNLVQAPIERAEG